MAQRRILVIQTAFLGDLLLSVPLFKYLKSTFPECEISLVCRKGFGQFLKNLNLIDQLYEVQKKNKQSYHQAIQAMRGTEFDLLLCPHESFTSAMMVRQIKAKRKIAFRKWWNSLFFTETVAKDIKLPEALRQMSLLQNHDPNLQKQIRDFRRLDEEWKAKAEKLLSPVPEWASPQVQLTSSSKLSTFSLPDHFICLFPGSVWKTKQWTEEGFIETGRALSEKGFQILVMGGPGEEDLAARVAQNIPGSLNFAGKTSLNESLEILARARLVLTNDSAGQHLAALVRAPTVAVFGPTILDFGYRPWNSKSSVVERKGLACRPCGKHGHQKCPLGTHECMKSITAKEVLQRIEEVMQISQSL